MVDLRSQSYAERAKDFSDDDENQSRNQSIMTGGMTSADAPMSVPGSISRPTRKRGRGGGRPRNQSVATGGMSSADAPMSVPGSISRPTRKRGRGGGRPSSRSLGSPSKRSSSSKEKNMSTPQDLQSPDVEVSRKKSSASSEKKKVDNATSQANQRFMAESAQVDPQTTKRFLRRPFDEEGFLDLQEGQTISEAEMQKRLRASGGRNRRTQRIEDSLKGRRLTSSERASMVASSLLGPVASTLNIERLQATGALGPTFEPKAQRATEEARQASSDFLSAAFPESVPDPNTKTDQSIKRQIARNNAELFEVQGFSVAKKDSSLFKLGARAVGLNVKSAFLEVVSTAEKNPFSMGIASGVGFGLGGVFGAKAVARTATGVGATSTGIRVLKADTKEERFRILTGDLILEAASFGGFKAVEKGVDLIRGFGARRIPATDVFDAAALRRDVTFPTSKSPTESLSQFRQARTPQGTLEVVSASPRPLRQRSVFSGTVDIGAGPAGARNLEDAGLFVTPQGRGSPYFLGRQSEEATEFSIVPELRRPSASVVEVSGARRQPESVIQSQGFEDVNRFLSGEVGKGDVFVTARSERGLRGITGKGGTTSELEGIIPTGSIINPKRPKTLLGRFRGYDEVTVVDGRVVPIRRFELAQGTRSTGRAKSRGVSTASLSEEAFSLYSSLSRKTTSPGSLFLGSASALKTRNRKSSQSRMSQNTNLPRSFSSSLSVSGLGGSGKTSRSLGFSGGFSVSGFETFFSGGRPSSATPPTRGASGSSGRPFSIREPPRTPRKTRDPFFPEFERRKAKPKRKKRAKTSRGFRFERSLVAVGLGLEKSKKKNRFAEIAGFGVRR